MTTAIEQHVTGMRRIADAAGNRPLTKSQESDLNGHISGLAAATKSIGDVELARGLQDVLKVGIDGGTHDELVDAAERWSARHNNGRKSAGRAFMEPDGPTNDGAYGTKALDWGRDFEKARGMAGKALLEVGSTAVATPLMADPIADPRQARFVYQLLPSSEAEGGSFGYLQQTTRTNNAAEVATGALKPVSVFTLQRVNDTVKVFAHVTEPIDRYLLEDAPNLRQFLDQELRYGLGKAFDAHVIADINTAVDLGSAGTFDVAGVRSAITELQEEDIEPDAIVMTPADWATMEAELTATYDANPGLPVATDAINRRLYGIPVMVTNSATAGEALIGDFRGSARIFRTGSASITIHDSQPRDVAGTDYADYRLNQLVLRAEMRAEVAVWRPAGFRRVSEAS